MKPGSVQFRTLCVVVLAVLLALAGLNRLSRMDARFFVGSTPGVRAVLHYLAGDFGGAARWYRTSLVGSVDPEPRTSWAALRAGKHELAATLARAELAQEAGARAPRLTLAEVALARGETAEALERAAEVLRTHTDDYDALLVSAAARARRHEWNESVDALKLALRQERTERRSTVFLAALEITGDLDDLETPPAAVLAHFHRYLSIHDPAQTRHATRYARRAIEAGDRADDGWVILAAVHAAEGRRRETLRAFDRALAVNGANTTALLGAAHLRADRGELASAYRLLRTAFDATPDDRFVVERLHVMLTSTLGATREALTLEQAQVAARPTDARSWWRLGTVQAQLADHAGALESFERALELRASPEAHEGRGWALRELGRSPDAVAAFQRAMELDPSRPGPLLGLAGVHRTHRRYVQAIASLERARELGARQGDQVVELCALYYETGHVGQASACLHELLAGDPDNVRGLGLRERLQKAANGRRPA
jgi:tetratricopeptide (TPR) repeat protein